ncbi:MAG: LPS export ABC transporter permease LptF [Nitrospinae bacterium]|nr:LPS export ABC transporter permease LptF [Nitrospinota bacterium]
MRLLDRYLFSELFKLFVMATLTLLAVLLLEKVNFLSDLLLGKGASFSVIGMSLLCLIPTFLGLAAPLAILMASLMTFSRMSADNEITAMRASGISLYRLLLPVLALSTIAMAGSLYLSTSVTHRSNLAFRDIVTDIVKTNITMEIQERRFSTRFENVMIRVGEKKGDLLYGVFIADSRNQRSPRIVEADRGRIVIAPAGDRIVIDLADGVIHTVDEKDDSYQTLAFETYGVGIALGAEMTGSTEKEIPHLSIPELRQRIASIDARRAAGERIKPPSAEIVALHQKFAAPLGCLALGLLGAPLGIMSHRRGKSGGFGLGVMMIVINYLVWMVGQGLGSEGKIPPELGVWAPNLVMGCVGLYLILRVSKDTMPTRLELWLADRLRRRRKRR